MLLSRRTNFSWSGAISYEDFPLSCAFSTSCHLQGDYNAFTFKENDLISSIKYFLYYEYNIENVKKNWHDKQMFYIDLSFN